MFDDIAVFGVLALGVAIFIIFVFLYIKDAENMKKLRRFERSIEELNQEVYKLNKKLKESESKPATPTINFDEVENALKKEIKKEMGIIQNSLSHAVQSLENAFLHQKESVEDKISLIEEKMKDAMMLPPPTTAIDENRIISLFQGGWSVDSIAKELRLPKGEVEFILKLSNLK